MEPEKVGGNLRAFKDEYNACATQILNAVKINSLLVSSAIQAACGDFKTFADDKIEKLKEQEEIDKLANEVLEVVGTAVSGGFAGVMIEGEIAKEVFKTTAEVMLTVAKAKAEPKSSSGFQKFVEKMIADAEQAGHDAQAKAISIVTTTLKAADTAVQHAEDDGVSLSRSKDYSFVEKFMFAKGSHFDALVTRYCGVPTPAMANKLQIKMTGDMIRIFTEKYVRATEDSITNVVVDDAPFVANQTANKAMEVLKKKHGFQYDD